MDILNEAASVASARWKSTEPHAETLTDMALAANPGWELATVYSYHCYEDYHAYCVVLWKQKGIKDGFALVGLRVCLYEKGPDGNFVLKNVERMG